MVGAISEIVVLDDILDVHELFFGRGYLFQKCVVVAVCLAAATGDPVVVVAMLRDQDSNYLVSNQVFPVCAGGRSIAEHNLG